MTITKKAYQSFKLAMLSLLLMFIFSAYPLTVHADSAADAIIDSLGTGTATTSTHIEKGVSYARTGYLCYLLTKDGNAIPGMTAKAFRSPGCVLHDGTLSIAKSRKGSYTATAFTGDAPWGCTPFNNSDDYGNVSTNEPTIKAWLTQKGSNGVANAINFVYDYWDENTAKRFMNDEYVLVIETMLNFQYSLNAGGAMTKSQALSYIDNLGEEQLIGAARASNHSVVRNAYLLDYDYYTNALERYNKGEITTLRRRVGSGELTPRQVIENIADVVERMRSAVHDAMEARYADSSYSFMASSSSGGRQYFGTPILGTLPNVLDYRTTYIPECTSNWFASYTNKAAAFAEYITAGKAGERAGFRPWTGSTTEKLTDGQVKEYGVGLMVISAHDNITTDATHTWDAENCGSTPGKAPEYIPTPTTSSLSRSYTIIKAYRTLNTSTTSTSTYINDGVYTREDTIGKILIEDEPTYTVVDWFTTSTPTATVGLSDATRWNESKSHASIMEQGNSSLASPITLPSAQKYLYVLLECTHTSSPPTDANYTLLE